MVDQMYWPVQEIGCVPPRDQTMTTANKIESEISALPPHLQAEVLEPLMTTYHDRVDAPVCGFADGPG